MLMAAILTKASAIVIFVPGMVIQAKNFHRSLRIYPNQAAPSDVNAFVIVSPEFKLKEEHYDFEYEQSSHKSEYQNEDHAKPGRKPGHEGCEKLSKSRHQTNPQSSLNRPRNSAATIAKPNKAATGCGRAEPQTHTRREPSFAMVLTNILPP